MVFIRNASLMAFAAFATLAHAELDSSVSFAPVIDKYDECADECLSFYDKFFDESFSGEGMAPHMEGDTFVRCCFRQCGFALLMAYRGGKATYLEEGTTQRDVDEYVATMAVCDRLECPWSPEVVAEDIDEAQEEVEEEVDEKEEEKKKEEEEKEKEEEKKEEEKDDGDA